MDNAGRQPRVRRLSVVTHLPLLTPRQVARLAAELQVFYERYLAGGVNDLAGFA